MSLELHHQYMLDIMARQDANAKFLLTKLEQENIILKEENEKLKSQLELLKNNFTKTRWA